MLWSSMKTPFFNPYFVSRVWSISWPTVIYALMETVVGMVDLYFAGFIGSEAVAAIGFSRQIFLVLMIGTMAITTGTITLMAQYYGAGEFNKASSVASHSFLLAVFAGILLGLGGFLLARPSLVVLGASREVLDHGVPYLKILMGGVIVIMINFSANSIFRALGDTKTPMRIVTVVNCINVVLTYLLTFGFWVIPPLGVKGIALGTVLARALGGVWAMGILMNPHRRVRLSLRPALEFQLIKRMLQIGLPSGFSGFFRNGARILFFRILAFTSAGTSAVAVASIGFQIRTLTILPALAVQVGTAALVGQSIGSNNVKEAESYGWTAAKLCLVVLIFLSLFLMIFPVWIVRFFSNVPEVIELAPIAIRFIALEQFCNCLSIVFSGALSGAGDTKPAMRYTIVSQWFMMLPLAVLLSMYPQTDTWGVWLAWGIAPIVQLILTVMRFASGRWKSIQATV